MAGLTGAQRSTEGGPASGPECPSATRGRDQREEPARPLSRTPGRTQNSEGQPVLRFTREGLSFS